MKTKLVYVLTCAPENNFIEQALISIYSARYHNPEAIIVLIVDDITDTLLVDKRAEVLEYISQKIVVNLPIEMSMMKRSRWLKTSCRNLVDGVMLYIDCDTIITRPLKEIDNFNIEIGAVLDSHLELYEYKQSIFDHIKKRAEKAGWDISDEKYYFSSGVFYMSDTLNSRLFSENWNSAMFNTSDEIFIGDQPYFALTDIKMGHLIQKIDDRWNCIMYTQPLFDYEANILHFSSYNNMSYLFGNAFLNLVKKVGIKNDPFVKNSILKPYSTYLVFDSALFNFRLINFLTLYTGIYYTSRSIVNNLNGNFEPYLANDGIEEKIGQLYRKKIFVIGTAILVSYKFYKVHLKRGYKYTTNICKK